MQGLEEFSGIRDSPKYSCRRGSRINTDRFPKRAPKAQDSRRVRGTGSPSKFFWIFTPEFPFPGFPSHSDRILARFQRRMCFYY